MQLPVASVPCVPKAQLRVQRLKELVGLRTCHSLVMELRYVQCLAAIAIGRYEQVSTHRKRSAEFLCQRNSPCKLLQHSEYQGLLVEGLLQARWFHPEVAAFRKNTRGRPRALSNQGERTVPSLSLPRSKYKSAECQQDYQHTVKTS